MKKARLTGILLAGCLAALSAAADVSVRDIWRWGLLRRSELPAEGYRMVVTTNVTESFTWTLNGSMSSTDEGNPTVLTCDNVQIPDLPKLLAYDGLNNVAYIPESGGWYVGLFSCVWGETAYTGFGVLGNNYEPWTAVSCWAEGSGAGGNFYEAFNGFGPGYYYGGFSLTRSDNPDIVTMTTNFIAVGGGAVLRDYVNPNKFGRLEDGVLRFYEVTGGVTNAL